MTGSGNIAGALIVQGGAVAPGDGLGTLSVGATTFGGSSKLEIELSSAVPRPGGTPTNVNTNDVLAVTGGLTLNTATSNMLLTVNGTGQTFGAGQTYDYFIATATGSITCLNPEQVTIAPSNFSAEGTFTLQSVGSDLVLSFTPVPEPVFATIVLASGAVAAIRRRVLSR